jgi:hypothetical protein
LITFEKINAMNKVTKAAVPKPPKEKKAPKKAIEKDTLVEPKKALDAKKFTEEVLSSAKSLMSRRQRSGIKISDLEEILAEVLPKYL